MNRPSRWVRMLLEVLGMVSKPKGHPKMRPSRRYRYGCSETFRTYLKVYSIRADDSCQTHELVRRDTTSSDPDNREMTQT
jgi:hypothetical protein